MRIVAIVLAVVLVTGSAFARLGETADQAETRYGPPTRGTPADRETEYSKGGLTITIKFFTTKSQARIIGQIRYSDFGNATDSTNRGELVQNLLAANANGKEWKQIQKASPHQLWISYRRSGADATEVSYGDLTVTSDEYLDALKAEEAERAERLREEQERKYREQQGF